MYPPPHHSAHPGSPPPALGSHSPSSQCIYVVGGIMCMLLWLPTGRRNLRPRRPPSFQPTCSPNHQQYRAQSPFPANNSSNSYKTIKDIPVQSWYKGSYRGYRPGLMPSGRSPSVLVSERSSQRTPIHV